MPAPQPFRSANGDGRGFRVLGVDPAVAGATGYGVIEFEGPSLGALTTRGVRVLCYGASKQPRRADFAFRLNEIHKLIARLLDEFSPAAVAVESVFAALNVRTALRLAEVRGVVLLAAAQANVAAHSYSPREVKSNVAGYGNATKQQMQLMVRSLLGLREDPEPPDAADALAVALCHAQLARARERAASSLRVARGAPQPGERSKLAGRPR